jgi:hypothetical protein
MKKYLIQINVGLAFLVGVGSYYSDANFWQPLLINIATTFFAAGLGILLVNVYLEKESRKKAVKALLQLSQDGISDFHNAFLDMIWTKFGKDDFGDLRTKYKKAGGNIMVLSPEQRRKIYDMSKENQEKLGPLLEKLDQALAETISLVGWTLDSDFLTQAIQARNSIRAYRVIEHDDADDSINKAAKRIIDIDTFSATAYHILKDVSGIANA